MKFIVFKMGYFSGKRFDKGHIIDITSWEYEEYRNAFKGDDAFWSITPVDMAETIIGFDLYADEYTGVLDYTPVGVECDEDGKFDIEKLKGRCRQMLSSRLTRFEI